MAFGPEGHSRADVDSVDLDAFPGIGNVPWWIAKMEAGDCLFIPHRYTVFSLSFDRIK